MNDNENPIVITPMTVDNSNVRPMTVDNSNVRPMMVNEPSSVWVDKKKKQSCGNCDKCKCSEKTK